MSNAQVLDKDVRFHWYGGVSTNAFVVRAGLNLPSDSMYLYVDEDSLFSSPMIFGPVNVDTSSNLIAGFTATGLSPNTTYFYAVAFKNELDLSPEDVGKAKTFPVGPHSFRFVLGSCSVDNGHRVYTVMDSLNPDFFLSLGDLHYYNPNSANINVHRFPFENLVLNKVQFMNLLHNRPFFYIWDDHDYCGNDSDSLAIGRSNARKVYQDYVPHFPLAKGSGDVPIYQSFVVGRIKFILTDVRSMRGANTMLGTEQKTWLKNEITDAKNNDLIVAWITTGSYNGDPGYENWGKYPLERTELADFFRDDTISNMFILSGDSHMLAIDNGSNSDFSTGHTNLFPYPMFQAAALNQFGSYKGGTFSEGYYPNPDASYGQFGLVDVVDVDGDSVCITFTGYRVNPFTSTVPIVSYSFCRYPGTTLSGLYSTPIQSEIRLIYPNPATTVLYCDKINRKEPFTIYSALGEKVKEGNFLPNEGVDISSLKGGAYFILFTESQRSFTFLKQ